MSFLAGKAYYRLSQGLGILLLPAIVLALFFLQIEEKVRARGLVESATQTVVTCQVKDTVVKAIHVDVGDVVAAGDTLMEFEDLQGYRNQAAQLTVKLQELEDRHVRLLPLQREGTVPVKDIKALEFGIASLKLKRDDLLARAARLVVRSPLDGRVVNILIKPCEKAGIGRELVAVSGGGPKVIKCAIPERHFTYLRAGQRVDIKSELYNYLKYEIYHGEVMEISPFGFQEQDQIFYRVTIRITQGSERLKVGSAADCEIITGEAPLVRLLFPRK